MKCRGNCGQDFVRNRRKPSAEADESPGGGDAMSAILVNFRDGAQRFQVRQDLQIPAGHSACPDFNDGQSVVMNAGGRAQYRRSAAHRPALRHDAWPAGPSATARPTGPLGLRGRRAARSVGAFDHPSNALGAGERDGALDANNTNQRPDRPRTEAASSAHESAKHGSLGQQRARNSACLSVS